MEVSEKAVGAMQAYLRLKRYILPSGIAREALQAAVPILSALEPSAARELALEEAAKWHESEAKGYKAEIGGTDVTGLLLAKEHRISAIAIRALSSPDHADAGKVEGEGWMQIERAPKDGTAVLVHFIPNEVPSLKPLICAAYWQKSDGLMKPGFWRVFHSVGPSFKATHWRHLPTPPSGEVA